VDGTQFDEVGTPASRRLAQALALLDRHRRHQDQNSLLGTADMRLLWLFDDRRPRTLRAIADELGLEQSTVNRQVNAALTVGILRRYREQGSPAYLFEATPAGFATFEQAVAEMLHSYDRALARFGEADTKRLLDLLDAFVDTYGHTVRDADGTDDTDAPVSTPASRDRTAG
jgi:DNA-binding MarR family transcriptional regulator